MNRLLRSLALLAAVGALAVPARAQWEGLPNGLALCGTSPYTTQTIFSGLAPVPSGLYGIGSVCAPPPTYSAGTGAILDPATATWAPVSPVQTITPTAGSPYYILVGEALLPTPGALWAGSSFSGLFRSTDDGRMWTHVDAAAGLPPTTAEGKPSADTRSMRPVALVDGQFYVSTYAGLFRSSDGGAHFQDVSAGLPPFRAVTDAQFRLVPTAHAVVKAGGSLLMPVSTGYASNQSGGGYNTAGGLFRSTDGGASWARVGDGLPTVLADAFSLAETGGRLVLSMRNGLPGTNNGTGEPGAEAQLWASDDAGASWQRLAFPFRPTVSGFGITNGDACRMRVEAVGSALVAACSFSTGNESVSSTRTLRGPYLSLDRGDTWADVRGDLYGAAAQNKNIEVADFQDYRGMLYLSGHTGGTGSNAIPSVWRRSLASLSIAPTAASPDPTAEVLAMAVGPNPVRGAATLRVTLAEAQTVHVTLTDVLGRTLLALDRALPAGAQALPLDVRGLAPGVYVARLVSSGASASVRFTVAR